MNKELKNRFFILFLLSLFALTSCAETELIVHTAKTVRSDTKPVPSKIYKIPKITSELEYFGLSPIPDKSNYTLYFDYWTFPSDLSSDSDTPGMPARFHDLVVARAKYYAHVMRSDPTAAQIALAEYEKGLQKMRTDLINKPEYMRGV